MNLEGKKVAITGHSGFLGSHLVKELLTQKAEVHPLYGDVRDPETFKHLDYTFDHLLHFGAPSSQILFKKEPDYAVDVTINGFRNALKACEDNGIKLTYPSTGLLSHNGTNEYARAKHICEDLAAGSKVDVLGLRVFGTYGPGEEKKRDFASVPYLFMRDMLEGKQPVIYGNGEQKRDFIYIEDSVKAILSCADRANERLIDIGSAEAIAFNGLVLIINELLGTNIQPVYIEKPGNYIDETGADPTILHKYYVPEVDFKEGMRRLIEYEQSIRQ